MRKGSLTHLVPHPRCGLCQRTSTCSCQQAALLFSAWALGALGLDGGPRPDRARQRGSQEMVGSQVHQAH